MKKVQAAPRSRHTIAIPVLAILLDNRVCGRVQPMRTCDAPPSLDLVYGQHALRRYIDGSGTASHLAHGNLWLPVGFASTAAR